MNKYKDSQSINQELRSHKQWITLSKAKESNYCRTFNISHTLVGNKIVDHSDVVGASPVGAAPTTSSFSI